MSATSLQCAATTVLAIAMLSATSPHAIAGTCNVIDGKTYGDCSNVNVNTEPKGVLDVRGHVSEPGLISGAVIRRGSSLELHGMSTGDITVEAGATLVLSGTVNGTIINNGGEVTIHGTARKVINNSGSIDVFGIVDSVTGNGKTRFAKGSVVGGKPVE